MRRFPGMVHGFFVTAALLLSCLAAADTTPPSLKVLTLNFNSENAPNDWDNFVRDHRYDGLVQWISENSPDIVFLEEAWTYRGDPSVALTIARATGYDLAYRLELGFPHFFYEADAVLTKKTLMMSDETDLKLPHSAFEIGNGKTWIIPFGAVSYAVGVSLRLADGTPLYAYATHLVGSSAQDREDQARAITRDARRRAADDGIAWDQAKVLVGGDFNSTPTDPAPSAMTEAGFVDSFDAAHPADLSCSDCADTTYPWFNPFTIGPGQFPSQNGDSASLRDDYVWVHGPSLTTLASTLMFTSPYNGVWMSDHYGVMTVLGSPGSAQPPNPSHDARELIPDTQTVQVTTDPFDCGWIEDSEGCTRELDPVTVAGPRGITIENRSDFYFDVAINGPGVIFSAPTAGLNPGEHAAFTFNTPGVFNYTIRDNVEAPNPYRAELTGTVLVEKTGY